MGRAIAVLASVLGACRTASSNVALELLRSADVDGSRAVVEADFTAELAREPLPQLPAGVSVKIECCAWFSSWNMPFLMSVVAHLPHPAGVDDVRKSLESYEMATGTPKIIRRPDFRALRARVRADVERAMVVLRVATGAVAQLADRDPIWGRFLPARPDGGRATSTCGVNIVGDTAYFHITPEAETLQIIVDPATARVREIFEGAGRRAIPVPDAAATTP